MKLKPSGAYQQLVNLSAFNLATVLYHFMQQKQAGILVGDFNTDVDILNALIQQPYGACEHRGLLYKALVDAFNFGFCRIMDGNGHTFVEVGFRNSNDLDFWTFDLGGYPSNLQVYDHTVHQEQETIPLTPPNQNRNALPQAKPTRSFAQFMDELLADIRQFPAYQRNILLTIADDKVAPLHASLLRYCQNKNNKIFYIKGLNAIRKKATIVTIDGKLQPIDSPLVSFVREAQTDDILALNWHDYSSVHLAHNAIMGDYRKIAGVAIAAGIINIGIIPRNQCKIDRDVRSRAAINIELPDDIVLQQPADVTAEQLADECAVKQDELTVPFYAPRWTKELNGQIESGRMGYHYTPGKLFTGVAQGKSGIVLHNAPKHSEDFQLCINELRILGEFNANGQRQSLPQNFNIRFLNSPFQLILNHIQLKYGQAAVNSYIVNQTLLLSFIQGRSYQQHQAQDFPGICGIVAGSCINLFVTEALSHQQWAWLLTHAKIFRCQLQITVMPHVTLPKEMLAAVLTTTDHFPATVDVNELTPSATFIDQTWLAEVTDENFQPAYASNSETVYTDDIEYAADILQAKRPHEYVFSVHANSRFSELFGHYAIDPNNPLIGDFIYGHIYNLLAQGASVILKGDLPTLVRQQLEPYFLPQPYFYLNGERKYPRKMGKLTLVTTHAVSIPFVVSTEIKIHPEKKWQCLTRYLPNEELFNSVQMACREFEALTEFRFSYQQLKTILRKIANGNFANPFTQFFRLLPDEKITLAKRCWPQPKAAVATTTAVYHAKRLAKFDKQLASSPIAFMVGSSGAGKTTFMREKIGHDARYDLHIGIRKIIDWAKARGPKKPILFLDEANTEFTGFWEFLNGIFDVPPGIFYKGQYLPLTPDHKIVFAGNYNTLAHRFPHKLFTENGNIFSFKPPPDFVLRDDDMAPIFAQFPLALQKNQDQIMTLFLDIYNLINKTIATHQPLTQRNLKTMCLRYLLYHTHYKHLFTGNDIDLQMALVAAYDEVATSLTKTERKALKATLLSQNLAGADARKQMQQTIKHHNKLNERNNFILTKSRLNPLRLLKDAILMRELKLHYPQLRDVYVPALLLEGESGIGKSELIYELLHELGYEPATKENLGLSKRYYVFEPGDKADMIRQLRTALLESALILIDEFNSIAHILEYEINTIFSGRDLDESLPETDGFFALLTQNPAMTTKNRAELSDAELKRVQKLDLPMFSHDELLFIVTKLAKDPEYAEEKVSEYLSKRALEDQTGAVIKSTCRNLFRNAREYGTSSKRPIDEVSNPKSTSNKRQCTPPSSH